MNHIKTMLCGNFIGIDKLEQLKLLQSDPLVNEYAILINTGNGIPNFWILQLQDPPDVERNQFQGFQKTVEKEQAQIHHHRY
jgi:hypothetical protein